MIQASVTIACRRIEWYRRKWDESRWSAYDSAGRARMNGEFMPRSTVHDTWRAQSGASPSTTEDVGAQAPMLTMVSCHSFELRPARSAAPISSRPICRKAYRPAQSASTGGLSRLFGGMPRRVRFRCGSISPAQALHLTGDWVPGGNRWESPESSWFFGIHACYDLVSRPARRFSGDRRSSPSAR